MLSMHALEILVAALSATLVAGSLVAPRATQPTPGKLRVTENSGVCETTPGVYQASGYGDLSASESMWFWFFEARHDAANAPLTLWLEGGRGTSSMRGLFQENGPCRLSNDSTTLSTNPYSWNEVSNVLYIDQPIGIGFSYGDENVFTGEQAASDVWKFLQIFFSDSRFSKYQKNNFGIWTEFYGASYAAVFGTYFLNQNARIANGTATGSTINLNTIGIGGGVIDPLLQYPKYLDYAIDNPYGQLVSADAILSGARDWYISDFGPAVQQQVQNCYASTYESNKIACWNGVIAANQGWADRLYGNHNPAYVRSNEKYPPAVTPYLSNKDVQAKIGAQGTYNDTNIFVAFNLEEGGTWLRNHAPAITALNQKGVRTLTWVGDADFLGNYIGQENLAIELDQNVYTVPPVDYHVNGHTVGQFQAIDNFAYLRVFGAGQQVGAYGSDSVARGQTALQFFNQTIHGQNIFST